MIRLLKRVALLVSNSTMITGLLIPTAGAVIFQLVASPTTASAYDADTYSWPSAPCEFGSNGGTSCANPDQTDYPGDEYDWYENGGNSFSGSLCYYGTNSECFDPTWKFEYRNCTDYVAEKIYQMFKVNITASWGNANNWLNYNTNTAHYPTDPTSAPQVGDIAVWTGGSFGHVAYVAAVNGSTATFDEYNENLNGSYTNNLTTSTQGTPNGYIHVGTIQTPPTDTDGDGVPDTQDTCPYTPGLPTNRGCPLDDHTVSGNFYGNDPYPDLVSFYDLGNDNLGAYVFPGQASGGVGQFQPLWTTGAGTWTWGKSKFVAGNFYGNDNYTDVIGFYDYGNGSIGAWLFPGTANGLGQRQLLWQTPANTMNVSQAKFLVGNFTGSHSYNDVVALYDYGGGNMGAFLFAGTGSGIQQQQFLWSTGANQWYLWGGKYVTGNFSGNDGYTDIVAFYDLGNANTGEYLMAGTASGIQQPVQQWTTGTGQFYVADADFLPGNFTGSHSYNDVVALYDYGSSNMGAFLFPGTGNGVNQAGAPLWTTGPGTWIWSETKPFVNNFAGSGTTSGIVGFYDYGNSDTGAFLFPSNGNGISTAQSLWRTGPGQWTWTSM